MHQMEDIAWVSILGTVGMLGAMFIVVGKLVVLYITTPVAAATEMVASSRGFHVGGIVMMLFGRLERALLQCGFCFQLIVHFLNAGCDGRLSEWQVLINPRNQYHKIIHGSFVKQSAQHFCAAACQWQTF
jgi:hypothetical protein